MLRTSTRTLSRHFSLGQLSISNRRFISSSPINFDGASKQGKGETVSVEDKNPIAARGETVKNAAKSVAEGVKGIAKNATGQKGEGSPDAMDVAGKNPREQQVEHGKKSGLAKKGAEQGGL